MKTEIIAQIAELNARKAALQSQIDSFEYEASDEEYDDMLDCEGVVNVCGLEFYPSTILKECDPVTYRCGKSDYENSVDIEDLEEYQDLLSEREEIESEIADLTEQLENDE